MSYLLFDEEYDKIYTENVIDGEYSVTEEKILDEQERSKQYEQIEVKPENLSQKYRSKPSDFDLLKVIGRGGYGKVLLARKNNGPDVGKLFAMKIINKATLIRSEKDATHTRSERNILELIKHKFIVDLIYAFQTNDKLYLVMEYVQGGELFTHLEREGVLPESSCRFYIAELTLALEYLHMNGIVYRDLKPENILLTNKGHIKLTDFGLCKESLGTNQTHTFCGTIEYMAPEILTRSGHTICADWWSLGAVMFDMLTGNPPFTSDSRSATIDMILRGRISIPLYLSSEAKDLIKKLLVRKPESRIGFGMCHATDIKSHIFFESIDWDELLDGDVEPPYIPNLKSEDDTSLFDDCFTSLPPVDTPCTSHISESHINSFEGFTYVAPSVLKDLYMIPNYFNEIHNSYEESTAEPSSNSDDPTTFHSHSSPTRELEAAMSMLYPSSGRNLGPLCPSYECVCACMPPPPFL